jgi:flavodoxin
MFFAIFPNSKSYRSLIAYLSHKKIMMIRDARMKRAVIVYWSKTGNTEKAAQAIKEGLEEAGIKVAVKKPEDAEDLDFFSYDLVCVGFPSVQWHPPKPMADFLQKKFVEYREQGKVKLGAPKVAGKNALVFCTYSGPHTGVGEAVPAGKYVGQFFEHLGFNVIDEWYVLCEFHGSEENSTKGKMGNIKGKPNKEDLRKIIKDAQTIARKL